MFSGLGQLQPPSDRVSVQSPDQLWPLIRYQRSSRGLGRCTNGDTKHPLDHLDVTFYSGLYPYIYHLATFEV